MHKLRTSTPSVIIRVGLPKTSGAFPGALFELDKPGLVSANSLWDQKRECFKAPSYSVCDLDLALDSAGFVVMKRWGVPLERAAVRRARKIVNERRAEQEQQLGYRPTCKDPEWIPCDNQLRIEAMKSWVERQT